MAGRDLDIERQRHLTDTPPLPPAAQEIAEVVGYRTHSGWGNRFYMLLIDRHRQ